MTLSAEISDSEQAAVRQSSELAQTYTGQWKPGTITNGNNVNITPIIDVKIDYAPGAKTMTVSYRSIVTVIGTQTTGGNFYDGFVLCIPPSPTPFVAGQGATGPAASDTDSIAKAVKDFNKYASSSGGIAWYVLQRNANNTEWTQGGTLSDKAWHTYTYDLSRYKAGDTPTLLYYGIRHWPVQGSCVYTGNILTTATFGMDIKIAPKVTSNGTEGGSISYSGEKYYEYGSATDTYTWQPDEGYRVSKVIIDGKEIENSSSTTSWTFPNITSDHSISVEFVRITVDIAYDMNAPKEDVQGEMPIETYDSANTSIPVKDCSYIYKGHRFVGWNTDPDGSGESVSPQSSLSFPESGTTEKITLYAQWEEIWHDVTWIDAHTGQSQSERVMDGYDASEHPAPIHEGYHLSSVTIIETDEESGEASSETVLSENLHEGYIIPPQYTSNIQGSTTYIFNYEPTEYAISIQYQNVNTGRVIFEDTSYGNAFKEWQSDIYPSHVENFRSSYLFLPEHVKIIDTETQEEMPANELVEITYDDNGDPTGILMKSTPACNVTIILGYDTWIQMPTTGESGNMILLSLAFSFIILGLVFIARLRDNMDSQME